MGLIRGRRLAGCRKYGHGVADADGNAVIESDKGRSYLQDGNFAAPSEQNERLVKQIPYFIQLNSHPELAKLYDLSTSRITTLKSIFGDKKDQPPVLSPAAVIRGINSGLNGMNSSGV